MLQCLKTELKKETVHDTFPLWDREWEQIHYNEHKGTKDCIYNTSTTNPTDERHVENSLQNLLQSNE